MKVRVPKLRLILRFMEVAAESIWHEASRCTSLARGLFLLMEGVPKSKHLRLHMYEKTPNEGSRGLHIWNHLHHQSRAGLGIQGVKLMEGVLG